MKRAPATRIVPLEIALPKSQAVAAVLVAFIVALAIWLVFARSASAAWTWQEDPPSPLTPFLQSSLDAADTLHGMLIGRLTPGSPILVASLVNLEDLNQSSSVGRLVSQQIASRLGERGYVVLDARLRGSMKFEASGGEFLLSRDITQLKRSYAAHAALVGTYSRGTDCWYISVRVLQLPDSAILAAYEYSLPFSSVNLRDDDDEIPGEWARYAPRQMAFPYSPKNLPAWSDPATAPQLRPLAPIKK